MSDGNPGAATARKKPANKGGRPLAGIEFEPKTIERKRVAAGAQFRDRKSAEKWMRENLSAVSADHQWLLDQLREDLRANGEAIGAFRSKKKAVPSELLRSRAITMGQITRQVSSQQQMLISLLKEKNLLEELGGEGEGGGFDLIVTATPPVTCEQALGGADEEEAAGS